MNKKYGKCKDCDVAILCHLMTIKYGECPFDKRIFDEDYEGELYCEGYEPQNNLTDYLDSKIFKNQSQKTAHWNISCDGYYPYCSNCNSEPQGRIMTPFCPNCGAEMTKE